MPPGTQAYERRAFPLTVRSDGAAPQHIIGHAAVFEELSEEMGWFMPFRERIARGAFDEALVRVRAGHDAVYALLNHDENYIIASTPGRTLDLSVDEIGLVADMQPKNTQTIRDLVVQPILDGDINKMSFGFNVSDEHEEKSDGQDIRVIDKIGRLYDVSPVTFPAYPQTDVQARSLMARLGIDPARLSLREAVSLRSFVDTVLPQVRQAPDDICAHSYCGHTSSLHEDGTGECEMGDGCEAFMEAASLPAAARKVARPVARQSQVAGATLDTLRRELELHREFAA